MSTVDDFFPLDDDFERILDVLDENEEEYSQYVSELVEDVSCFLYIRNLLRQFKKLL